MTNVNAGSANDIRLPELLHLILDAEDALHSAQHLVELIGMTVRHDPDEDAKAISQGCEDTKSYLETCGAKLTRYKEQQAQVST